MKHVDTGRDEMHSFNRYLKGATPNRAYMKRFPTGLDLDKSTMKDLYTKFGLEAGTQDFIGHAMALHLDDE